MDSFLLKIDNNRPWWNPRQNQYVPAHETKPGATKIPLHVNPTINVKVGTVYWTQRYKKAW